MTGEEAEVPTTSYHSPARELAQAGRLDHDVRWSEQFGHPEQLDLARGRRDRQIERIGYDPLHQDDPQD